MMRYFFQLPSLPANLKLEKFDELLALPSDLSFFPLSNVPRNVVRLSALEMLDATRIPKHLISYIGPTITVRVLSTNCLLYVVNCEYRFNDILRWKSNQSRGFSKIISLLICLTATTAYYRYVIFITWKHGHTC